MKTIFHKVSLFFADFFNRKPVVIVMSFLCALIIWFAIVMNVYSTAPMRFYNIPVEIPLTGTNAEANGLSVVDYEV